MVVDFPVFMEVVKESGKRNIVLENAIYFLETKDRFIFYYDNGFWKFKTVVKKADMGLFLSTTNLNNQKEVIEEFNNKYFAGRNLISIVDYEGS
jgi:hypothetical protein